MKNRSGKQTCIDDQAMLSCQETGSSEQSLHVTTNPTSKCRNPMSAEHSNPAVNGRNSPYCNHYNTVIRLQAQNLYMYSTLAQAALRRLALRCLTINITQEQQHDRHPQDRHQHSGAQGPCGPKD